MAETTLLTTLDESTARLKSYIGNAQAGTVILVRFWPFVDAKSAKALVDAKNVATAVTDPKADGVSYTGSWYGAAVVGDGEDDRSVTVTQTLVTTPQESKSFSYKVNCLETRTVSLQYGLTSAALQSAVAAYSSDNYTAGHNIYIEVTRSDGLWNLMVVDRVAVDNVADSTFESEESDASVTKRVQTHNASTFSTDLTAVQGEVKTLSVRRNEFCRYDTTAETQTSREQPIAKHVKQWDFDAKTEEQATRNALDATVTSDYTLAAQQTQGVTVAVDKTINRDGTYDAVKRTITAIRNTIASFVARWAYDAKTEIVKDRNLTDAQVADYALAAQATAGQTVTLNRTINPDGTHNVEQTTETALDQTISGGSDERTDTYAETVDVTRHTASATAAADVAAAAGVITTTRNEQRPDGKYRTEVRVVSSKDQTATQAGGEDEAAKSDFRRDTLFDTTDEERHTAADAALDDVAQSTGVITETRSDPRPDGKYSTASRTITSKPVTAVNAVVTAVNAEKSVVSSELVNQTAAPAAITAADGTDKTRDITRNPDGTYSHTDRTATYAKIEASKTYTDRYGDSYYASGEHCTSTEVTNAITAASLTAATDNSVSVSKEPNGLFSYVITKRPYRGSGIVEGWELSPPKTWTTAQRIRRSKNGVDQMRTYTYTYSAIQTFSKDTAYAHISPSLDKKGRVEPMPNGQYRAIKVTCTGDTGWVTDTTDVPWPA